MKDDIDMPSLRSDKEDDTDEEWTTKDTDEDWQQEKCKLQLYKTGKQELIDLKKVSIDFLCVAEKQYLTQLITYRKCQFHWYIDNVEPVQGGRYVTIYNDLWYNDLQCNPSKMGKTIIINHVL